MGTRVYQITDVSMEHWWNETDRGKFKDSEQNISHCNFVTSDPIRTNVGSNRPPHGDRPVTNPWHGTGEKCIQLSKPEWNRSVFGRPGHRQECKVKRNSP